MKDYYLSICAIFRNEASYLDEWIQFHKSNGVEHFFLYNHLSTDDSIQKLTPYIDAGIVTTINWLVNNHIKAQPKAYQHCLDNHGQSSRWIAFIDLDEFLFSPCGNLVDMLKEYESYCGVVVHWQCYGSSGHVNRPDGLVTENYLYRAKTNWVRNQRVKSIVNPDLALRPVGPHFFKYNEFSCAVNENHIPVTFRKLNKVSRKIRKARSRIELFFNLFTVDPYAVLTTNDTNPTANKLRINHYSIKSYNEFLKKITKHESDRYDYLYFRYHDRNEVYDPILKGSVNSHM